MYQRTLETNQKSLDLFSVSSCSCCRVVRVCHGLTLRTGHRFIAGPHGETSQRPHRGTKDTKGQFRASQFTARACSWTVPGNPRTWREPKQKRGEHVNSPRSALGPRLNPRPSGCEATVFMTVPSVQPDENVIMLLKNKLRWEQTVHFMTVLKEAAQDTSGSDGTCAEIEGSCTSEG